MPEKLTMSPKNSSLDRWLVRSLSQVGEKLGIVRDRIFTLAQLQRHHLMLDLNARSRLLTWEAVRQAPEGGVTANSDKTTYSKPFGAMSDSSRSIAN